MSEPTKKPERTWRAWLGRLTLAFLTLLAVGVVVAWVRLNWEASKGRGELADVLAELDASDPRWRWEEIREDIPPIPDAENSALVLQRMSDALRAPKPWEQTRAGGRRPFADMPPPNRRLDDARLRVLRDELGRQEEGLALALSLKGFPRGRAEILLEDDFVSSPFPHEVAARDAAEHLTLDVERLLHAGRAAEVPDNVRATLHAGASLRDDGTFRSAGVRLAIRRLAVRQVERLLGMGEPSDAACRELSLALAAERQEDPIRAAARGERAGYHRLFESLKSGRSTLASVGGGPNTLWDQIVTATYASRLPEDHAYGLRRMTELAELTRLRLDERPAAVQAFEAEFGATRKRVTGEFRHLVTSLFTPSARRLTELTTLDRAELSCAIAALAAERYRLANGRWPEALDEAVRYAKHAEGVTISSAGPDDKDIVLRMFDVARRGSPAEGKE